MTFSAAFTASALSGSQAHEISFETGAFNAPDDGYRYFDEDYAVLTRGVRGAFALSEHWAVAGSWATANEGLTVESDEGQVLLATGFRHHRVAVGPRFSWQMAPWFTPYASLQGLVWTGTAASTTTRRSTTTPVSTPFGAQPSAAAMLGAFVEPFTLGKQDGALRVGVYGELGYGSPPACLSRTKATRTSQPARPSRSATCSSTAWWATPASRSVSDASAGPPPQGGEARSAACFRWSQQRRGSPTRRPAPRRQPRSRCRPSSPSRR